MTYNADAVQMVVDDLYPIVRELQHKTVLAQSETSLRDAYEQALTLREQLTALFTTLSVLDATIRLSHDRLISFEPSSSA